MVRLCVIWCLFVVLVLFSRQLWKDGKFVMDLSTREHRKSRKAGERNNGDFGYLILRHPAFLQKTLNSDVLIKGNGYRTKFVVGWYKRNAHEHAGRGRSSLLIQPSEPFGVNTQTWSQQQCKRLNVSDVKILPSRYEDFQEFTGIVAEKDWDGHRRVYKLYDSAAPREVELEIPRNRSIFQHAFPETLIVDDQSLTAELRRNHSSWIIRISGHVTTCPSSFSVELVDQYRPSVKLFQADLGIVTQPCTFMVEFSVPTQEDLEHADRQFTAKLKDSQKTLRLTLVRPRPVPTLAVPRPEQEFDLEKLGVLIPIGSTTGGLLIALILILIYGYKTKPRDKYQRDRDNQLHVRHLLFVVWLVGLRLTKSFLLTFYVFSVILSAIHHTNVQTLRQFGAFCEKQNSVQNAEMNSMDRHRVQEIQRQRRFLEEGEDACETKLRELEEHLDHHYKEVRQKQAEDRRRKSIIRAATARVKERFGHLKGDFELKRVGLNQRMRASTAELNSRVQGLQDKVDKNFWLKAAHVMYDTLDALAAIAGGIKKPFMRWVGLHANIPDISLSLGSFDDVFGDFENKLDLSLSNPGNYSSSSHAKRTIGKGLNIYSGRSILPEHNISKHVNKERIQELLALEWIAAFVQSSTFGGLLLFIDALFLLYRHCKTYQSAVVLIHGLPKVYKLGKVLKDDDKKLMEKGNAAGEEQVFEERKTADPSQEYICSPGKGTVRDKRIKKAAITGQKESFEMKEFSESATENAFDNGGSGGGSDSTTNEADNTDGSDERRRKKLPREKDAIHATMRCLDRVNGILLEALTKLKELNYKINNTDLVPICILIFTGLVCVYIVIVTAKYVVNVETLEALGIFDLRIAPVLSMRGIVNTRITSNAHLANDVQIPYYQGRVNSRIALIRKKARLYQAYQCARAELHNREYCAWAGPDCHGIRAYSMQAFLRNLSQFECYVQPVIPRRYLFDEVAYKRSYKRAIQPYVTALRSLVLDTFYMVLVVAGISIILKMSELAVFVILKKFDLIRQVKLYQTNHELTYAGKTKPQCLLDRPDGAVRRRIGPVQIAEAIKEKCGPAIREGTCSSWAA